MNYQVILLFITAAINSALSLLVLFGKRDRVNIIYSVFVLFASLWSVGLAFFILENDTQTAAQIANLYYMAAAGIPIFFLYFSLVFLNKNRFIRWYTPILFLIPLIVFAFVLSANPHFILRSVFFVDWGKDVVLNKGGYLGYSIYFIVVVCLAYRSLLKTYFRVAGVEKKQLQLILWGTLVGFVFGAIFNLFLPYFGNYRFIYLGPLFSFSMVVSIAYSISKYRLFELKVITTQISTFILWVFLFVKVLVSGSLEDQLVNLGLLVITIIAGIFLIKSVTQEVKRREELQDLTKKLETSNEKLQQLDQARADFITIASHQLRTPPTTIKWYLSAVKNGDYGKIEGELKETLLKTEAVNNSLIALIDDLLNASRIERGKMEFIFSPTDILKLVRVTVDQLEPLAGIKALKLNFTPPQVVPPLVMADGEKVRQVINNFIDNAIKYTTSGEITVNISTTPKEVVVEVSDSGKGFSPEAGQVLFEKYVRGQSAAIHSTGLGLGLYVAKVVMEQHKGRIWAKSEGEGKGSTFGFALPIHNDLPEHSSLNLAQTQNNP